MPSYKQDRKSIGWYSARDPSVTESKDFTLEEATITEIHTAFKSGELTCQELVSGYMERIEAYDKQGPKINAIITQNPDAMSTAARLDEEFSKSGLTGSLHCVP